jgi:fructose-1,6-bisphosphatase/inositol monophosphatase family enzyme
VASGSIDVVIEAGLKLHDFAALVPVIEGAGGVMTDWQGRPLDATSGGEVIAAGDRRVHAEVLAALAT